MIRLLFVGIVASMFCGRIVCAQEDSIPLNLAAAKQNYAVEIEGARIALLDLLKEKRLAVQKSGNLSQLEIVIEEEEAFESKGELPESVQTRTYAEANRKARKKLEEAYVEARKAYTQAGRIDEARAVDKELQDFTTSGEIEFRPESHDNSSIDLLSQINPQLDTIRGVWRQNGKSLVGPSPYEDQARIGIPVWPSGDYELSIRFTRLKGPHGLGLTLPVLNRQVNLVVGDGVVGLQRIDGKFFYDASNPTHASAIQLVDNKEYTLLARVLVEMEEAARIQIEMEGKPLIDWRGSPSQLSMITNWEMQDHRIFGLHAWDTVLRVDEMRLRMLSGKAKRPWNMATR